MGNASIVTKKVYSNIGKDLEAFDWLPKVVRDALRETAYEYSAEQALEILVTVRREFPRTPFNLFRPITEHDIAVECARHIRETDRQIRENEQWNLQYPITTNSIPNSAQRRNSATKRTEPTASQWETIRRSRGLAPRIGKSSQSQVVSFLDGTVIEQPKKATKTG